MDEADEMMEGSQLTYIHVTELENHGISRADTQRLASHGFCTIQAVAHATVKKLCEVKGISDVKAAKLQDICYKLIPGNMTFITAAVELQNRNALAMLTTGSKELDKLCAGKQSLQLTSYAAQQPLVHTGLRVASRLDH